MCPSNQPLLRVTDELRLGQEGLAVACPCSMPPKGRVEGCGLFFCLGGTLSMTGIAAPPEISRRSD